MLNRYAEVTPDMFQDDVFLRFIGLESIHTYGQRATGIVQWLNLWGPLLPSMPGVNLPEMMRLTWEHMVGKHNTDQMFEVPTPRYMLWDQAEENLQLRRGRTVRVDPEDDDLQHMQKMWEDGTMDMLVKEDTPQAVQSAILEHFQDHKENAQRKMAQKRADEARQQQEQQAAEAKQGVTPGQGRPAAAGGVQAQPNEQKGVTPGPTQARTVSRGGRQGAGVSQSQTQGVA